MVMKKGKGRSLTMGTGKKRGRPTKEEVARREAAAAKAAGKSAAPEVQTIVPANRSMPSEETIAEINERDRSSYARVPGTNDKGQVVIVGFISAEARDYWMEPSWTVMKAKDVRQLTRPARHRIMPEIKWDDRVVPDTATQPAAAPNSMGSYIPSQTELAFMANTVADKFIGWFEKKYGPRLAQNIVSTLQEGVIAALNTGRENPQPSHVASPGVPAGAPASNLPMVQPTAGPQAAPPPAAAAPAVERQQGSH